GALRLDCTCQEAGAKLGDVRRRAQGAAIVCPSADCIGVNQAKPCLGFARKNMRIVHLMASPFYGGPERQMLGLARHLPRELESVFLSFAERGLAQAFLDETRRHGFEGKAL